MTIDEKIANAKRQALTDWLQGEMWHQISYQKYEDHYLKSLYDEKARQEKRE